MIRYIVAQVDSGTVWAVTVPMVTALIAVAWKLGGLDRRVKDLGDDVSKIEHNVERMTLGTMRGGRRFNDPK